jgi:hypothetical protein
MNTVKPLELKKNLDLINPELIQKNDDNDDENEHEIEDEDDGDDGFKYTDDNLYYDWIYANKIGYGRINIADEKIVEDVYVPFVSQTSANNNLLENKAKHSLGTIATSSRIAGFSNNRDENRIKERRCSLYDYMKNAYSFINNTPLQMQLSEEEITYNTDTEYDSSEDDFDYDKNTNPLLFACNIM